jgi:hypothetical protein
MIDWTHKKVAIDDVRKVRKFYILSIEGLVTPIFVDQTIFEGRVNSYYLRDNYETNNVNRHDVLDVKWNLVVTQGFFYKVDRDGPPQRIEKDPDKYYISFLEIDGPLGTYVPQ